MKAMNQPGRWLWLLACAVFALSNFATAQDAISDPAWRYRMQPPEGEWQAPDYDDSKWRKGMGGFGTPDTPGSRVGTNWRTKNIWMRRVVELASVPEQPALYVHHDEDVEVFINGKLTKKLNGFITEYQVVPLSTEEASSLKGGKNVIAVHCSQTGGGQFVDVHVIDARKIPKLPEPEPATTPYVSKLITEWGKQVTAANVWQEYPRPALVRNNWTNLNGKWNYAITKRTATDVPAKWDGEILVPFSLESKLSGVQRLLSSKEALWYKRSFDYQPQQGKQLLLNFEAVDYRCRVWVNGQDVGGHVGGNDPFTLDVTAAVKPGSNDLIVRVEDDTEAFQLNGKQHINPQGIWYTQVSGIWQTVWMEQVSNRHVAELKINTNATTGEVNVKPVVGGAVYNTDQIRVSIDGKSSRSQTIAQGTSIQIDNPKLWSPSNPHLYNITVELLDGQGNVVDEVKSYTGIRSVGKIRDDNGDWRFTLNGEVIFHWGPLDQGWWPDGLLTPPSDAAMLSDIEFLKASGFNMIRKHIKVEPRRYYHHCDKLGMMVWQDQVSGGKNPPWTRLKPDPTDAQWPDEYHQQFMHEFEEMVTSLEKHPCIVVWTPFNEAWGQHRTVEVGKWIAQRDPTRIINIASGGNFWPVGDVVDEHQYPHPGFPFNPERYKDFVKVVGEFGGHGLPVEGHIWDADRDNWGYGGLPKNATEYRDRYLESIRLLGELKKKGIAAGVYTQTTDVEGEINGLLTYDRAVKKIAPEELKKIHEAAGLK